MVLIAPWGLYLALTLRRGAMFTEHMPRRAWTANDEGKMRRNNNVADLEISPLPVEIKQYGRSLLLPCKSSPQNRRPHSSCTLLKFRLRQDSCLQLPQRVERALRYTEHEHDYLFYRAQPQQIYPEGKRTHAKFSLVKETSDRSQLGLDFKPETGSLRVLGSECHERGSSQQSGTSVDSESISLISGVFQNRKHRTKIILSHRQLSNHERVMEWLFKSCTHPVSTLPLLWQPHRSSKGEKDFWWN